MTQAWISPLPRNVLAELEHRRAWGVVPQTMTNVSLTIILSAISIRVPSVLVWIPVWWIQAILFCGFLVAAHDCAHSTFMCTRRWNRILGPLWSSTVLFNFSLYRYYHLEHHRYTNVEGDTEPLGTFRSLREYLGALPMLGFFVPFWVMSFKACFGSFPHFVRTAPARRAVIMDNIPLFLWICTVVVAVCLWPRAVLVGYIAPIMLYFPMVFWTSIPEHYACEEGRNPLTNTRTVSSSRVFGWLFWHGNYHAEHHCYPSVPSYNLPRLHKAIADRLVFREKSYIVFHLRLMWSLLRGHPATVSEAVLTPMKRVEYYDVASSEPGCASSLPAEESH